MRCLGDLDLEPWQTQLLASLLAAVPVKLSVLRLGRGRHEPPFREITIVASSRGEARRIYQAYRRALEANGVDLRVFTAEEAQTLSENSSRG